MAVAIASSLLGRLRALADASRDVEVCGLLLGSADRIDDVRPAANVAADPRAAFEVDPVALFAALREERAGGARLVGHYHSHPAGDPRPSPSDAAAAGTAPMLWLILGEEVRLWRASAHGTVLGAFEAVDLRVLPDAIARSAASRHKGAETGQVRG